MLITTSHPIKKGGIYLGKLDGRVALVTGGARGIGAATVQRFVEEGAKVVFTDILVDEGQALQKEIGKNCTFLKQDVSDEKRWAEVIDETEKLYGPINVLVNNAGILLTKTIEDTTVEEYNNMVFINQTSVFMGMKAVLESMKRAGKGSIVNMSSAGGLIGTPGNVAYGATKFAIRGMTKVAALEYAQYNIRVNSVHPAITLTPMIQQDDSIEIVEQVAKTLPLGRGSEPVECAEMILFLASDESSFSTGSEFITDGGLTAS